MGPSVRLSRSYSCRSRPPFSLRRQFSKGFIDILTETNVWATDKPTFVWSGKPYWAHSVCAHFCPRTCYDERSLSWLKVSQVSRAQPTAVRCDACEVARCRLFRTLSSTLLPPCGWVASAAALTYNMYAMHVMRAAPCEQAIWTVNTSLSRHATLALGAAMLLLLCDP